MEKNKLISKVAKAAKISEAKAKIAYETILKEGQGWRKQSLKTAKVKDQVAVPLVKEVVKIVKVVKEVPVEVIKEITLIREVEVVKEVPVEIIKEVEVVKRIDFESLKKMMAKMGTVEVSKKVIGETRNKKEGKIVSRREVKPGTATKVPKAKATKKKAAPKKTTSNTKAVTKKKAGTKKDDLKKVEGIGPKIEQLLHAEGINTFKKLSTTSPTAIKKILDKAGPRYQMHNPKTWPKQSGMAAKGDWDKLSKWQDELKGGK